MTKRIDHAAEAQRLLEYAASPATGSPELASPEPEVLALAYAAIAQTHATLALAEQQRVANLQTERSVQAVRTTNRSPEIATAAADLHRAIEIQIREGLGL